MTISIDWQSQIFEKKKKKKKGGPNLRPTPKMKFFVIFLSLDHKLSLNMHTMIACDNV